MNLNVFKYEEVKKSIQLAINNLSIFLDDISSNRYFIVVTDMFGDYLSSVSTCDKDEALNLINHYKKYEDAWTIFVEKPNVGSKKFFRLCNRWESEIKN